LLQATRTEPIVLVSSPTRSVRASSVVAAGFMAFEYRLSAKWLKLLKQIGPGWKQAAVLWDPAMAAGIGQFAFIQSVAPSLGLEVND
jgi:putative ABC transport system substrate-binding protein